MAAKISQASLRKLVLAKSKLEKLESSIKQTEDKLLADLKAGATVQNGLLVAEIKEWSRRSPAWKAVVERELGEEYAARVLAGTRPDKFEKLVVEVA